MNGKKDLSLYFAVRSGIRTGDPVQFSSSTLVGLAIRWWTKSDVNHTAMAIRFRDFEEKIDRVFIIEAMEHGLQLRSLSERLSAHKGKAWWLPLRDEFDNDLRRAIGACALGYLGKGVKYDYQGCILGNLINRAKKDDTKLFCSEALYRYIEDAVLGAEGYEDLKRAVLDANRYLEGEAPTPADIPRLGLSKDGIGIL